MENGSWKTVIHWDLADSIQKSKTARKW